MRPDAIDIALLARASTTSLQEAVDLIQSFAAVIAHEASAKAIEDHHARTMAILDVSLGSPLVLRRSADA